MSAIKTYVLRCDVCGVLFGTNPPIGSAWQTRTVAKAAGWAHSVEPAPNNPGPAKGVDRCPACLGKETTPAESGPVVIQRPLARYAAIILRGCVSRKELAHPDVAAQAADALDPFFDGPAP